MRALRLGGDGWRDVSWFDEVVVRVAASGMGELWFVVGNRRGVLGQVRARARDLPGCVVAGPDAGVGAGELRDGLVGVAGTTLGVINPLAELALVVGDAAVRVIGQRQAATGGGPADLFGVFDDLVGAAVAGGDTVVFIVDADDRDEDLWNQRFTQYTARAGRLRTQRLVIVVGLADAPADPGAVDESFPRLVCDAASLVAEGKAHWHPVPPLTPELVAGVLPVSAETARLLATVAGGDDHLASQRWESWVHDGVVRPDREGIWSLTGDPVDHVLVGIERAFNAAFATDRARSDGAHLALMCAAQLGEEFCAESVLQTAVFAGEDHDSVEDDLDALTGDNSRPGLVATVGWDPNQPGHEPEHLWRYRFVDPAVAAYYRGVADNDPDRERHLRSLLTNLIELRLHDGVFDIAIGRLARDLGERATAQMIEDRCTTRQELTHLDTDATVLLSLAPDWDPEDLYLCEQLTQATGRLGRLGLADRAVACGSAARTLARANPTPAPTLAATIYELGVTHRLQEETGVAIDYFTDALAHRRALYEYQPSPAHRRDLATTIEALRNLGEPPNEGLPPEP